MKEQIISLAEKYLPQAEELVRYMYDYPEVSGEEVHASQAIVEALKPFGFTIEYPFMAEELGYGTAFRATLKRGEGPKTSIMVEYDALPGIGHGCGHNLHGSLSVLAAMIMSRLPEDAYHGTLEVIGTPGEEVDGAKLHFAPAGVFDDDDLAIMMHSASGGASRTNTDATALRCYDIQFTGKTAHAAGDPWNGANALTAARKFLDLLDARRDSFRPYTIASAVITDGGKAPNVVPDVSKVRIEFRYPTRHELQRLDRIIRNCARGAAIALECEVTFTSGFPDFDDMVRVPLLEKRVEELFRACGEPVDPPLPPSGSTDAGNVSYRCPTIHPYICITDKVCPGHSAELRDATITEHAMEQMKKGAVVMCELLLDIYNDEAFRKAVRADFEKALAKKEGK
jgi:amidohydrolase